MSRLEDSPEQPKPLAAGAESALGAVEGKQGRVGRVLASENFSFKEAVGGWRGFVEAVLPGLVFVVSYLIWEGFRVPVVASVSTVAVMVVARLIQRTPVTQALSGAFGVGLGALWAWTAGEASAYFVPGLWINGAYLFAVLVSMLLRWPAVGVLVGLLRSLGTAWRHDRVVMRRMQWASGILAAMFALRLAVQLPLYFTDQVAALGTARLAMGLPLFALTLWIIWVLVQNVGRVPEPADPRPQP